jgi:hypothetical protein
VISVTNKSDSDLVTSIANKAHASLHLRYIIELIQWRDIDTVISVTNKSDSSRDQRC